MTSDSSRQACGTAALKFRIPGMNVFEVALPCSLQMYGTKQTQCLWVLGPFYITLLMSRLRNVFGHKDFANQVLG